MFDDYQQTQTQQATEPIEVVELPPSASRAIGAPLAAPVSRDPVSQLLPPAPAGRDLDRLARSARQIGERLGVSVTPAGGSRALYSFPAGKSRVEGPTVWLIGALWQEYGHVVVDSEVREERAGRVAIVTTIVDRINGTAYRREHHTSLAPAPAKFAANVDQAERWATMQLQSAISKAERTTVQHFLPGWYVDLAVDAARKAFGSNVLNGKSISEAQAEAVAAYERKWQVTQAQLEEFIGAERPLWTITDLAELRGTYQQLARGELTVGGVFGASSPAAPRASQGGGLDALSGPAPSAAPEAEKKPRAPRAAKPAPAPAEQPAPPSAPSPLPEVDAVPPPPRDA